MKRDEIFVYSACPTFLPQLPPITKSSRKFVALKFVYLGKLITYKSKYETPTHVGSKASNLIELTRFNLFLSNFITYYAETYSQKLIQFRQGNQIARLFVQCLAIYSKGNLPNRLKIDKVFQILQNLLNLTESSHMHTDRGPRANSVYKLCS